jgi:cytochrome c oxidase cbb3-type subunit 2
MLKHEQIEKSVGLLIVLTLFTVIWGGLLEIVPLFFQKSTTTPVEGVKPYDAVRLVGRDVFLREGCYLCHSQMIRPFRAETERYGHYSVAGESVYDHPFQWGPSVLVRIWHGRWSLFGRMAARTPDESA